MAAPAAAGEIARMEKVSDTPRPTTAIETAPNADPTLHYDHRLTLPINLNLNPGRNNNSVGLLDNNCSCLKCGLLKLPL